MDMSTTRNMQQKNCAMALSCGTLTSNNLLNTMKSTKVQTLGELRMRGGLGWRLLAVSC